MLIHSKALIDFYNGNTVLVEQLKIGDKDKRNAIDSLKVTEELSEINKNPIGTIAYNSIVLKIQTNDNSLTPENTSSPYYGYMDTSAIVKITLVDDKGEIEFGTYYVDRWYSNISSDERKLITIEASGYMKTISKMLMPSMQIKRNQKTKDYILEAVNKQNETLTDRYKIQVDENISFGDFDTMEFSDVDAEKFGEALETISQSTLTNIYIDRDNKMKTDYCFDDTTTGDEETIGDCINIKQIKVGDGGLSDYAGVEVKYNNYLVNNMNKLASLNSQKLRAGNTEFNGIGTTGKIYKLMSLYVDSDASNYINVENVKYGKNSIDITVKNTSGSEANANIEFYGQTLNENQLSIQKYIQGKKGTALTVTNNIIGKDNINTFADKLIKLIGIKNNVVETSGWFDPHIKLGDIVYLDAEKTVNTKGYYKVVKLEWQVNSSIFCVMKMNKLVQ